MISRGVQSSYNTEKVSSHRSCLSHRSIRSCHSSRNMRSTIVTCASTIVTCGAATAHHQRGVLRKKSSEGFPGGEPVLESHCENLLAIVYAIYKYINI